MIKKTSLSIWRGRRFITLCALFILWMPLYAFGITFPDKPSSEHYFVDDAGLISEEAGQEIDRIASTLLSEERIPIYVVTIPSMAGQDAVTHTIERYAQDLFNEWGIGWQDRNYGILLLVSKGDRKARIELGADWGFSHDRQAQQIMDELIIPAFKRGDFSRGIAEGVRGLDAMARGLALPKPEQPWWVLPAFILGAICFVLMIVNLFKKGHKGWAWALIVVVGTILFFLLRNAGSGGGFGGGSSGGGGASGSW